MELRITELFGLPAHPLLIHMSVALVPIAAALAILAALKPDLMRRWRWPVVTYFAVTIVSVWATVGAGEEMHDTLKAADPAVFAGVEAFPTHETRGRNMLVFANWFAIATVLWFVSDWLGSRRDTTTEVEEQEPMPAEAGAVVPSVYVRYAALAARGLLLLTALWATYSMILAGHSGAASVWQ